MNIELLDIDHKVYERFLKSIVVVDNNYTTPCWVRRDSPNRNGYTRLTVMVYGVKYDTVAHRYSYKIFIGPIADELLVDHKCRIRACCNPDHLEAVSHSENTRRGDAWKSLAKYRRRIREGQLELKFREAV